MGSQFIKCSFNKDADHANPDIRDKLYTYADPAGDLKPGDLAEVVDPKGATKRVRVMESGVPQPKFACKPAKLYAEPVLAAPANQTPNMDADRSFRDHRLEDDGDSSLDFE